MYIMPNNIMSIDIICEILAGVILFYMLKTFSKGKAVGDIADIKLAKITVKNSELYVDDIFVTKHLGTDFARKLVENSGIAAVIYPKEKHFSRILNHSCQRQVIIFEACRILGLKRYNYTKCDYAIGRIAVMLVPIIRDEGHLLKY